MLINRLKNKVGFLVRKYLLNINVISPKVKIGRRCSINGCHISGDIEIGENCKLNQVHINGNVTIGANTSVWGPNITITAEINHINIGNYTSIARGVTIQEFNHDMTRFSTYYINKNILENDEPDVVSDGPISIGHDVWIGSNVTIVGGVTIGTGAVIGANSVVTKDIPPYGVAVGAPAKTIRYRFDQEVIARLLTSKWWECTKEELKNRIEELDRLVKKI